jgi:DNA-binding MarR family transcriptional regulator
MAIGLKEEIKQTKPFSGIEQEALLNIHRTSGYVSHFTQQLLKKHGLTGPQYNVLRILRGAGPEGLRCAEIGERMLSRDPDITRLLERLQRQRLIERRRDAKDRRVVYTRISGEGLRALKELDPSIEQSSKVLLRHMSRDKVGMLIRLLEEVREGAAA